MKPSILFLRKSLFFLGTLCAFHFLSSCCCKKSCENLSQLESFVAYNYSPSETTLNKSVDLYVDYSTCVAEAQNSAYYMSTRPAFVDCAPTYYSIKGANITKETSDPQQVYHLLSSIKEYNNADIKKAVSEIVSHDNQAVLITDGEYYLKNATRDNLNNPYLAEEFRTWLKKGRDIYIFSEPYLESGKYLKSRFYMLFTDAKLDNNIYDRFARSAPKESQVKMLHLNNGAPCVSRKSEEQTINDNISSLKENCKMGHQFEIVDVGINWEDMQSYLQGGLDQRYIARGVFVPRLDSDGFRVRKIEPVVYQVTKDYLEYLDSVATGGSLPYAHQLTRIKDVIDIDVDSFEQNGEIVLVLKNDFDGVGDTLSSEEPNLLKVDIVVKEVEDQFSFNSDLNNAFKWTSISAAQKGATNTSIYESISQVLKDPEMSPVGKPSAVIYTFYINTCNI